MAGGGQEVKRSVLLGYVDEWMEDERAEFYTNKVGGLPDWCDKEMAPEEGVRCGECEAHLVLVTQVYAPLADSPYHRSLHLFGCLQPPCWNKDNSWVCVRSQLLDKSHQTSPQVTTSPPVTTALSVTDWLGEADDWGDDDNGNVASASTVSTPSPVGAVGGVFLPSTNLNMETEIPFHNLNISGGNRKQDTNANVSPLEVRGASAPPSGEPSAVVEMDAEDSSTIALDTPEVGNTNLPGLFATPKMSSKRGRLRPAYLWVQEEGPGGSGGQLEHEKALLNEYKAKEALEVVMEGKKGSRGGGGGDLYEKTVPSHGDKFLHKMITVLQENPGQVLRYARGTVPLLLRPLKENKGGGPAVPACRHCGADSVFELQLLPSLVFQLRLQEEMGEGMVAPIEFGTVLVFTCSVSCWAEQGRERREQVVVQPENM